jgi:photosynthetic reaction center cytochrome c subunit
MLRMRVVVSLVVGVFAAQVHAQAPGKWPPDSLINVQVIPKNTPPVQVWGQMRNIASGLGVTCTFCHAGQEGAELAQINFASDEKRNKQVARQMMRMVQEVNKRLDTIPARPTPGVTVTCSTCHRGVNRPIPLANIISEVATASGADSATRVYRSLRERYYGRDAYDFSEGSLNAAAFRTARAGKIDDALALLRVNEGLFPNASALYISRGNIALMRADTAGAAAAFREAVRRDPTNDEARGRLRDIGQRP